MSEARLSVSLSPKAEGSFILPDDIVLVHLLYGHMLQVCQIGSHRASMMTVDNTEAVSSGQVVPRQMCVPVASRDRPLTFDIHQQKKDDGF